MITHWIKVGKEILELRVAPGLVVYRENGRIIVDFPKPLPPTIARDGIRNIAVPADDEFERASRRLRAA